MIVNVAIPTYRPDNRLKEIIRRLNEQTIKPDTILIINTVKEWVDEENYSEFNNLRFIHIEKSEFDHGATRNRAMALLRGDYTIMMTQDAMPANTVLIEELIKPMMNNEEVVVTYARQLANKNADEIERITRLYNYPDHDIETSEESIYFMGIKAYFCSDVCAAYRVNKFDELGGFPGRTIFNEDSIYAAKALSAGYRKVYASQACVYHSHNYPITTQFMRNFDNGVSHRQFSYIFKDELMKTEDEGKRLVMETARELLSGCHVLLLLKLLSHSAAKLLGYRLGKMYDKLPYKIVVLFSMNTDYWTGRR